MSSSKPLRARIRARVLLNQAKARRRSQAAAEAIARGEIIVPMRCVHCQAPAVLDYESDAERDSDGKPLFLRCISCSRTTSVKGAHIVRRQEIAMIIKAGMDPRRRG